MTTNHRASRPRFFTDYAEQAEPPADELVIPENLSELSDEALQELHTSVSEAFQALYAAGQADGFSQDALDAMEALTDGLEALSAEVASREEAAATRQAAAAELAARAGFSAEAENTDEADGVDGGEEDSEEDADGEEDPTDEGAADTVTAASAPDKPRRVNLAGLRKAKPVKNTSQASPNGLQVLAAPELPTFSQGASMTLADLGVAVNSTLNRYNHSAYALAAEQGRELSVRIPVASIHRSYSHMVDDASADHDAVLAEAANEANLPGGSLLASGGWCAPSETVYDLFDEGVSREGLVSLPEVGVSRGGIRFTKGISFGDVFSQSGFFYTEAQDIAGQYGIDASTREGNNTDGDKPCFEIPCPDFEEVRLDVQGVCIKAGLLKRKGYPELIAQGVQYATLAHMHRESGRKIARIAAGSTAIAMPENPVGTAAPLLSAIELQVENYLSRIRASRSTTLEAIFPYWVRGAIRADLSRRLGVDLLDVNNARIDAWFRNLGIKPQYVYNWQDFGGFQPGQAIAWPSNVQFLLYKAGTWVAGMSPVLQLDTFFDSTQLGTNDYTALWFEEAWLLAKRGYDSRVVSVPICQDGATAGGIAIECDGTATPAPVA